MKNTGDSEGLNQPTRQSRRQMGLSPPVDYISVSSNGPSIQNTNTSYQGSSTSSIRSSNSRYKPNQNLPSVSSASLSQYTSVRPLASTAVDLFQNSQSQNFQFNQQAQPKFSSDHSHSSNRSSSLRSVAGMNRPQARPNIPFDNDDLLSTTSSLPQSTLTPSVRTPEIMSLELLQQKLQDVQRVSSQTEIENQTLRQQVLMAQQQMSTIFETVTQLNEQNQHLTRQLQHQHLPTPSNNVNTQQIPIVQPSIEPSPQPLQDTVSRNLVSDSPNLQEALITLLQSHQRSNEAKDTSSIKFPKFAGKSKTEFKIWYDQVLAILASPGWVTVFQNVSSKTLKLDEEITGSLSSRLYAALRTSLSGNAEKLMMTKTETWGKGLLFLNILKQTYRQRLHRADLLQKEKEYSLLFQSPSESIDDFATRCITLRDLLLEHDITASASGLRDRFIMGLGPLFTELQQTPFEDLPTRWQTDDIQKLINYATSYKDEKLAVRQRNRLYNEVNKVSTPKPTAVPKQPTPTSGKGKPDTPRKAENTKEEIQEKNEIRQAKIEQDIKKGIFDPMKYAWEVRRNCCVWHDSNTHTVQRCSTINSLLASHPTQKYYAVPPHVLNRVNSNAAANPNARPPPTPAPTPLPAARHTRANPTEVPDMDNNPFAALCEDPPDNVENNDTNNSINTYSISCNNVSTQPSITSLDIKFIVDSGAYPHMIKDKCHFTALQPWTNKTTTHVTLADGDATAKIEGSGNVQLKINNHYYELKDVLYVPDLSDSLFSVKKHQETPGHYAHFEKNELTLAFPTFLYTSAIETEPILKATAHPNIVQPINKNKSKELIGFKRLTPYAKIPTKSTTGSAGLDLFSSQDYTLMPGERHKLKTDISVQLPPGTYGRIAPRSGISMSHSIDIVAGVIDNDYRGELFPCITNNGLKPFHIRKYDRIAQLIPTKYADVTVCELDELTQTKRNKGGFGSTEVSQPKPNKPKQDHTEAPSSNFKWNHLNKGRQKVIIKLPWNLQFQKGYIEQHPDGFSFSPIEYPNIAHILPASDIKKMAQSDKLLLGHHHHITKISSIYNKSEYQPLRTIDKPLSNSPSKATYSIDQLKKGMGFRNVSSILKELKATATNFNISTTDSEPVLDLGDTANMDKQKRNTTPLSLPQKLGDVVHMDIIFGSGTSIGGYRYTLFLVDRATRYKFIYPMRDLKTDIIPSLQQFIKDIGSFPKLLRTDFDAKLIGKSIQNFFITQHTQIESAPPEEQNKNGLCERNWRTILRMARSWLVSALLPSEFWWYALKRATEVANYFPIKIDSKLTTPHEMVYNQKVDMRNIFPLFGVAYPKYKTKANTDTQSCRAIIVGRSNTTHALEFYHPPTKNIITTSVFQLDESLVAGPVFNLPYDGGIYFNKYSEHNEQYRPPKYPPESTVYLKNSNNNFIRSQIINIPVDTNGIYTVQYEDGSIHQVHEQYLLRNNPLLDPASHDEQLNTLPPWIINKAKCTLFLNNMQQPSQGILEINNNIWEFRPGHKHHKAPIPIPDLDKRIRQLIQTHQIFKGHVPFRKVYQARQSLRLSNIVANHVSAKALTSKDPPNLLKHCTLSVKDKQIWDKAYEEEYLGLRNLPAWVTISEQEYIANKHTYGTLLPTMALSTIKYDQDGNPKRAKYRIVALGNLDPHDWTKQECFAPVMSLMEVRFLTAMAVRAKRVLQSGDFKQAFVQALLPSNETYILKPPIGCPLTPKHTYWMLKRSLYGLKRAPRHWYEKAKAILEDLNLKSCPNAQCIFSGQIIPNRPPLYLGLYVDDFIYYSEDPEVEKEFAEN